MFQNAVNFNNGEPVNISVPNSPLIMTMNSNQNVSQMFLNASSFNQKLKQESSGTSSLLIDWDLTACTDMSKMFENAVNFNNGAPIITPSLGTPLIFNDTGYNVTNMQYMLKGCSSFSQILLVDLGAIPDGVIGGYNPLEGMLAGTSMTVPNYTATLENWIDTLTGHPYLSGVKKVPYNITFTRPSTVTTPTAGSQQAAAENKLSASPWNWVFN